MAGQFPPIGNMMKRKVLVQRDEILTVLIRLPRRVTERPLDPETNLPSLPGMSDNGVHVPSAVVVSFLSKL